MATRFCVFILDNGEPCGQGVAKGYRKYCSETHKQAGLARQKNESRERKQAREGVYADTPREPRLPGVMSDPNIRYTAAVYKPKNPAPSGRVHLTSPYDRKPRRTDLQRFEPPRGLDDWTPPGWDDEPEQKPYVHDVVFTNHVADGDHRNGPTFSGTRLAFQVRKTGSR